jgi:hypothetical protein
MTLLDYAGTSIRLTDERLAHIQEHPEIAGNIGKITETLAMPDTVVKSRTDKEARLYYKYYEGLSIGNKYLCIVVKFKGNDAFMITAYFTDTVKKGDELWKK